jgi:adenosylcobinamide-GDP ribazoletransferase
VRDVIRRLLGAIAFLTRLPVPLAFDAADVGRATLAFPLVGALLGGGALLVARAGQLFPPTVTAVLLVAFLAVATGALHLDGLADTVDGFGGGKTRDDVLRIMRDHAIGAYGATALILILLLKIACVAALLPAAAPHGGESWRVLVLAPMLARWASVPLCRALPYARASGLGKALGDHVGAVEIVGATLIAGGGGWWLGGWRALACIAAVTLSSAIGAVVCARRIGGVTGDTLGANTELSEVLVYLVWLACA